jgi:regulator of cell morphogenesis and NO signaling
MTEAHLSTRELGEMPVNRVIRDFPATVEAFNRHGIDACCGGAAPVREAALRDGADPDALVADLLALAGEAR